MQSLQAMIDPEEEQKNNFEYQIKFFNGYLERLKTVTPNIIKEHVTFLIKRIEDLQKEKFFQDAEEMVREMVKGTLKEYLKKCLIKDILGITYTEMTEQAVSEKLSELNIDNSSQDECIISCAHYLLQQEEENVNSINAILQATYEQEIQDFEDDPDSREHDYEGPLRPTSPKMMELTSLYSHAVFTDPDNLEYLMEFCGGEEGLQHLIYQICQDDIDIDEVLKKEIIKEKGDKEESILSFCIDSLLFHYEFPEIITSRPFIARTYTKTLKDLENNILEDWILPVTLERICQEVRKNYPRDLQELDEWRTEISNQFNEAIEKGDYLSAQRTWYSFCGYVFRTNAILDYDSRTHSTHKQAFTSLINELKKQFDKFHKIATKHNIVYPSSFDTIIYYSAKNKSKITELDLRDCFSELKSTAYHNKHILEQAESSIKTDKDKDKAKTMGSTNIVVPILYFLVTDRPYDHNDKNAHKRMFVKVPLLFSKYKNKLLSQDPEDGVNSKNDTFESKHLIQTSDIRNSSSEAYHYGRSLITNLIPEDDNYRQEVLKAHNNLIYHSEPLMILALQDKENAKEIVKTLREKITDINKEGEGTREEGQYKVYAAMLVIYSTNSICNDCSIKLIGNQSSYTGSFVSILEAALNSQEEFRDLPNTFFTKKDESNITKFRLITIVASDKPFSNSQARDMQDLHYEYDKTKSNKLKEKNAEINELAYQKPGIIHFPKNKIDINKVYLTKIQEGQTTLKAPAFIFEYTITNPMKIDHESSLVHKAFMSGSKQAKYKDQLSLMDGIDSSKGGEIGTPTVPTIGGEETNATDYLKL